MENSSWGSSDLFAYFTSVGIYLYLSALWLCLACSEYVSGSGDFGLCACVVLSFGRKSYGMGN